MLHHDYMREFAPEGSVVAVCERVFVHNFLWRALQEYGIAVAVSPMWPSYPAELSFEILGVFKYLFPVSSI